MQLSLDPRALQPDLLSGALSRLVPDASLRRAVTDDVPVAITSAELETAVLERWARTVEWSEVDVIVALGLGTGLFIDLVRSRSDAVLLVLEPRTGVIASALSSRPSNYDDVTIYGDVYHLRTGLRGCCSFGTRVMFFAPSWAREELADHVEALEETIRDAHRMTLINENTEEACGDEWNELILDGLNRIVDRVPLNRLGNIFKGVPGVVVASGPSLDKNIDMLEELEGKAVICALNSSLAALNAAKIKPNLLAAVESQDIVSMVADSPDLPHLYFTPGLHSNPKLYDLPFKSIMPAVTGNNGIARWLCRASSMAPLPVGGSVACLAFSILETLGCDPIILVGQDCALEGERMYASGTPLEDIRYEEVDGAVRMASNLPLLRMASADGDGDEPQAGAPLPYPTVRGWGGGQVRTIPQLNGYRLWFEERAHALKGERWLVNATEGGAAIDGFEELRLAQVVEELRSREEVDVSGRLGSAEREASPLDATTVVVGLREEAFTCGKARELANGAAESARRLLALMERWNVKTAEVERELARLENYEDSIRRLTPEAVLLDTFVGRALERIRRKALRHGAESVEQGTRQSLEHSLEIFEEIAAMAATLAPRLDEIAAMLEQQGRN